MVKKMILNGDRSQSRRIGALERQKAQQKENQNLNEGEKAGSTKDHQTNAAVMSSKNHLPERRKLELLLGKLKRRDVHRIFSEPVNAEEVEFYYDVIKKPMDFGTITAKLNGGSYKTLQEFERDVTLVWSNALVFNNSSTIYYKQARVIRNLSKKLFKALKSDPENFLGVPKSGCRGGRGSMYPEVDIRSTYRPPNTLVAEKEPMVTTTYLSPQQLAQSNQSTGYTESLLHFVKDLGPAANTDACRKLPNIAEEADDVERRLAAQDIESFRFMDALLGITNTNLEGTCTPVPTLLNQDWRRFRPTEAPPKPVSSWLFPPQPFLGGSPVPTMPYQDWRQFRPIEAPPQPISSRLFPPQSTSAGPSKWQDSGASTSHVKPITLADIDEWLRFR